VTENAVDATIGTLSVQDPDQGDTISYQVLTTDASGNVLLDKDRPAPVSA
jgi:hypothetical protein